MAAYSVPVHDQRGSNVVQAAAVALFAAVLIAAMLGGARQLAPAVQQSFECLVQVLAGGGATCSGSGDGAPGAPADTPGAGDAKPWYERLWDGIGDAAGWLWDEVLTPVGEWLKDAWSWLWQEHEWGWWKDALQWLRDRWWGYPIAAVLGFLGDFLFGIGSDGKFSWGGVVLSTLLTIAAFFTAGLTKIPAIARILAKGGKLLSWIQATRVWKWLAGTSLGRWLGKLGPGGFADVFLEGKLGNVLRELLPLLERRFPWLKRVLDTTILGKRLRDLVEPVGNYVWRLIKDGPFGLAKDIAGKLFKRFAPSFVKEALERLSKLKEWQGIWDWLREPKLPWPFS